MNEEEEQEEELKRRRLLAIKFIAYLLLLFALILALLVWNTFHPSELSEIIEEIIDNPIVDICDDDDDCVDGICWYGYCVCADETFGELCNETCFDAMNDTDIVCLEDSCCGEHGECWYGRCLCSDGYSGVYCEILPICPNITLEHCETSLDCVNGICHYGICKCESPIYWGDLCELERRDLSYCLNDGECLNGGVCIPNNVGNGECYCPESASGNNCEIP